MDEVLLPALTSTLHCSYKYRLCESRRAMLAPTRIILFPWWTGSSRTSTPTDSGSHSLLPLTDCFLPFLPMRSYPQSKRKQNGGRYTGRQRGFVNFFRKKFTNIQNQHCGSHGLSTRGLSSLPFAWWVISSCAPTPV